MTTNGDYSYKPPSGFEESAPVKGSEGKDKGLPTKKMGETEAKTTSIADQAGITKKGLESEGTVIRVQKGSPGASGVSSETVNVDEAVSSVKDEFTKGNFTSASSSDSGLLLPTESMETIDPMDYSGSETSSETSDDPSLDSLEGSSVEKSALSEELGSIPTAKDLDSAVHDKFLDGAQEMIKDIDTPGIRDMVKKAREEVADAKQEFKLRAAIDERLESKIDKSEKHIKRLEGSVKGMGGPSGKGGSRTRARRQRTKQQIALAKQQQTKLETQRSPFATDRRFSAQVQKLMKTGTLKPVSGGKSGVYFLCDNKGVPKYVIKPYDEDMLTLNNPKGFATPFRESDSYGCRPKTGVSMYSASTNEMMASVIAREIGVSRCTARAQLMILTSDSFHDITDDIEVDPEELTDTYGAADKEKLCVVQEFIPGSTEVGELLLTGSNLSQDEFMEMDWDERSTLERNILPKDIDQDMYEEAVILALVCGEADGNAGNYLVSDTVESKTNTRALYKIDNAAAFTDDNSSLRVGAEWVLNCYDKKMSDRAKKIVQDLDADKIADLMQQQGYSEQSISEMRERVLMMKIYEDYLEDDVCIGDWALTVEGHFQPEEDVSTSEYTFEESTQPSPEEIEIQGQIEALEEKISKQEGHIEHLEGSVTKRAGGGKRARARKRSVADQVSLAKESIATHKKDIAKLEQKLVDIRNTAPPTPAEEAFVDGATGLTPAQQDVKSRIEVLEQKITKQEGHIKHLESSVTKKAGGGKRTRARKRSAADQIALARENITSLRKEIAELEQKL